MLLNKIKKLSCQILYIFEAGKHIIVSMLSDVTELLTDRLLFLIIEVIYYVLNINNLKFKKFKILYFLTACLVVNFLNALRPRAM